MRALEIENASEAPPVAPTPPPELKKWPLRRTFGFLLVLGGLVWIALGLILKLLIG
jgi:hypothetical protein